MRYLDITRTGTCIGEGETVLELSSLVEEGEVGDSHLSSMLASHEGSSPKQQFFSE